MASSYNVTYGKMSSAQSYVFLFFILPVKPNSENGIEKRRRTAEKYKQAVEVKATLGL